MDKAARVVRRSGVKLLSLGVGHSELNLCISESKDVKTTAKGFMASQYSAANYMMKWAATQKNVALQDVSSQVMELAKIWTDVQKEFIDRHREFHRMFEMILEGERKLDQAKNTVATYEEKEAKLRKELKKAQKRSCSEEVRDLARKLENTEIQRHVAENIVQERYEESETVKVIRFKEGLLKLSAAYAELGSKCEMLFEAQQAVAHQIPDVCRQNIINVNYSGSEKTAEIVSQARERVKHIKRYVHDSQNTNPSTILSPPPPYSPGIRLLTPSAPCITPYKCTTKYVHSEAKHIPFEIYKPKYDASKSPYPIKHTKSDQSDSPNINQQPKSDNSISPYSTGRTHKAYSPIYPNMGCKIILLSGEKELPRTKYLHSGGVKSSSPHESPDCGDDTITGTKSIGNQNKQYKKSSVRLGVSATVQNNKNQTTEKVSEIHTRTTPEKVNIQSAIVKTLKKTPKSRSPAEALAKARALFANVRHKRSKSDSPTRKFTWARSRNSFRSENIFRSSTDKKKSNRRLIQTFFGSRGGEGERIIATGSNGTRNKNSNVIVHVCSHGNVCHKGNHVCQPLNSDNTDLSPDFGSSYIMDDTRDKFNHKEVQSNCDNIRGPDFDSSNIESEKCVICSQDEPMIGYELQQQSAHDVCEYFQHLDETMPPSCGDVIDECPQKCCIVESVELSQDLKNRDQADGENIKRICEDKFENNLLSNRGNNSPDVLSRIDGEYELHAEISDKASGNKVDDFSAVENGTPNIVPRTSTLRNSFKRLKNYTSGRIKAWENNVKQTTKRNNEEPWKDMGKADTVSIDARERDPVSVKLNEIVDPEDCSALTENNVNARENEHIQQIEDCESEISSLSLNDLNQELTLDDLTLHSSEQSQTKTTKRNFNNYRQTELTLVSPENSPMKSTKSNSKDQPSSSIWREYVESRVKPAEPHCSPQTDRRFQVKNAESFGDMEKDGSYLAEEVFRSGHACSPRSLDETSEDGFCSKLGYSLPLFEPECECGSDDSLDLPLGESIEDELRLKYGYSLPLREPESSEMMCSLSMIETVNNDVNFLPSSGGNLGSHLLHDPLSSEIMSPLVSNEPEVNNTDNLIDNDITKPFYYQHRGWPSLKKREP